MKEVIARLKAPTPQFFKNLQKIGATIAILATTVMTLESQGVELPEIIGKVLNVYTMLSGILATIIPQLTAVWTDGNNLPVNNKPFEDK